MDAALKTSLDPTKTITKKLVHKPAEATVKFIGNKIVNKLVKPKSVPHAGEIVIPI